MVRVRNINKVQIKIMKSYMDKYISKAQIKLFT